jgi:hypothetical protein
VVQFEHTVVVQFEHTVVVQLEHTVVVQFEHTVVVRLEHTPKAFANFSPGLELATTLGHTREKNSTLKALAKSR